MKIGIIGAGQVGSVLARRLSDAGHVVSIANSRSPETISKAALATGAKAVRQAEAVVDADVVIVSVPFARVPEVAQHVFAAPENAIVIDTSNYFPHRDGAIEAIESGEVESLWTQRHYRRPIVKAWNNIWSNSLVDRAAPPGTPGRLALPVAADDASQRAIGMRLVEQTGFDAFDAGVLADSWRQQPGTPAYTTDLTKDELTEALARADVARSARRRDLMIAVVMERMEAEGGISVERQIALHRAIF